MPPLAKALTWSNISWMLWGMHSMVLTIPGFPCLLPLTNIISARLPLGYLLMRMRVARGPIRHYTRKIFIISIALRVLTFFSSSGAAGWWSC